MSSILSSHDEAASRQLAQALEQSQAAAVLEGPFIPSGPALSKAQRKMALAAIEGGANPRVEVTLGTLGAGPALAVACLLGEARLARSLIDAGADVEAGFYVPWSRSAAATPLWCSLRRLSAGSGWRECALALIDAGADAFAPCAESVWLQGCRSNPPALAWALFMGSQELVQAGLAGDASRGFKGLSGSVERLAKPLWQSGEGLEWVGEAIGAQEKLGARLQKALEKKGASPEALHRFHRARERSALAGEAGAGQAASPRARL